MSCLRNLNTALLIATFAATPAYALGTVKSPNIVKGELEFEYMGSTTFDNDASKRGEQEHEFEIEYGLTDRFLVELATEFEREPGEKLKSSKVELAGRYQLFEKGEYWIDSGLQFAYEHATHRDDPDALEAKLLLEKQMGAFLHRANFSVEKEIGSHSVDGVEAGFAWSSRYRYNPYFEPGFEIHSDFGKVNDELGFNEQEHYIGPAIYGKLLPNVKYEAGYFFGVSDATTDGAARLLVEYEIYF